MQVPLLQNILNPQVENKNSLLMGEKKIGTNEADIFSKLLQGVVDDPEMQKGKKDAFTEANLLQSNDDSVVKEISQTLSEQTPIQDNESVLNILGGEVIPTLSPVQKQEVINTIAANPKLIEIFAKTENVYEIIPRLKDLMARDPQLAKEVATLVNKMKGEQSQEVFKLGRTIATGSEVKVGFTPKKQIPTIAHYGKAQNAINKNIINVHRPVHTSVNASVNTPINSEINAKGEVRRENVIEFPHVEAIQPKVSGLTGEAKVFNIETLGAVKGNQEIIGKIADYVQQQNIQGKQSLDLVVKHDELGQFKLNVAKHASGEQVSIRIVTGTEAGRSFFTLNENRLASALDLAGIKVGDVKIISSVQDSFKSEFDNKGSQMDQNSNRSFSQQGQDRNGGDKDSQRRRELWEMFQERNSA